MGKYILMQDVAQDYVYILYNSIYVRQNFCASELAFFEANEIFGRINKDIQILRSWLSLTHVSLMFHFDTP